MKLSKYIDHTLLRADAKKSEIEKICDQAVKNDFATVMVNPCWISFVKEKLSGTNVMAACVIGFPLGANTTAVKVFETQDAIAKGADEIDMVINIGQLKDKNDSYVIDEIRQVKMAAGSHTLKVIIETCLLTDEEKVRACKDIALAGADFAKTSTGFSKAGATVSDVKLMKKALEGSDVKVKAAGGIKCEADFKAMIEAGAERIGTSAGAACLGAE